MILRAGLTGGIASGKSTIARIFQRLGCTTFDADALVARLYQPGRAGHAAIVATYGNRVVTPSGEIDRKKLADLAFSSAAEAQKLNALIHPIVLEEEARLVEKAEREGGRGIYIVEATLLLEAGGKDRYHRIVVVDVDPAVQVARGVARGMTEHEVRRRIANQMPREERLRHADYVIDNSAGLEEAERETARVHAALLDDYSRLTSSRA